MEQQLVSAADVARVAKVSRATVSNAINHPERVSAERLKRIQSAIDTLGYVPSAAARQLRSGRSGTVGLLLLDAWNPGFSDMARGVEDATGEVGLKLVIANSGRDLAREREYFRLYNEQRVSGIIVVPHDAAGAEPHSLKYSQIPVVALDRRSSGTHYSVSVDDTLGGELVAKHLLDLGHKSIVFAGNPEFARPVRDRLFGLKNYIERCAPDTELTVMDSDLSIEGGHAIGNEIANREHKPTSVVAAVDLIAFGILQAFIKKDIRVPEDISLCGYDDIQFAKQLSVPLTTVKRPHYEMGRSATQLLKDLVDRKSPETANIEYDPHLVVRSSTARPRH